MDVPVGNQKIKQGGTNERGKREEREGREREREERERGERRRVKFYLAPIPLSFLAKNLSFPSFFI
jgi:hypothetical protein